MISDFSLILFWWLLLFSLGVAFLPLTLLFFRNFFDKGYAFSKILAVLFVSYLIWFLGSLEILSFSTKSVWLIIGVLVFGNLVLINQQRQEFKKIVKKHWRLFAFEELLFLVGLIFWSLVRGYQPNIQGLEKFMDFGFINSILRAEYFPPADMWLAGETVNYYYFGHLVTAVLTKLSKIDSAITYNLMIATIFAFSLTAAFSLGGNLVFATAGAQKKKQKASKLRLVLIGGMISALLLNLGGNLHLLYWFLTHGNLSGYWYPDATRFIVQQFGAADNTIHEFPLYSFVVADLHGHLLNLPFILLFLALVSTLLTKIKRKLPLSFYFLAGLLLGIFFMTNAWDFPIYLLVFGAAILWFNYLNHGFAWETLWQTFKACLLVLGLSLFFSLLFHVHFKSIIQGIALTDFHSPPWMLLVLWGFPLFTTLFFLFFLRRKKTINYQLSTVNYFVLILLTLAWLLIIIPEIIYIKDIYIHSHQRANTVFKLTYQAFVIFSITGGYIIVRVLSSLKNRLLKLILSLFILSLYVFIFLYPCFAIRSYYGLKTYQGLYGLNYLRSNYPDDYQAILWLKKNVSGQPVIAEAVGESYTDFARVSTNTGLPTVLGWRVHEWLWRGSFEEPAKRTEEVKIIYESSNLDQIRQILNNYRVRLIFIGKLERQQYPQLQEEKFEQLGKVVFSSGLTKIYQVNLGLDL